MARIQHGTINSYLQYLTSMELDHDQTPNPLEDMEVFDSAIVSMAAAARREGNLENLQLALDALISEPNRIQKFPGHGYPFSQDEFERILTYAFRRMWPGVPVSGPGEAVPVDFV